MAIIENNFASKLDTGYQNALCRPIEQRKVLTFPLTT